MSKPDNENHTILIIDDEPDNIEAIIECLKESKYKISVAIDGESGIKIACQIDPSLILLDWEMPKLSGIETLKLLKSDDILKNTPIIMETGKMIKSEDLKIALEAGADDYIRKPIDKIELIARVRSIILLYETMAQNLKFREDIFKQKEESLRKEIEKNKNELAYFTLRLVQQSKFNKEIIEKIEESAKYADNSGKKILRGLICRCKLAANQSYWEEFEKMFMEVHKTFYLKLNEQFPDLSNNERRMAAFCKLNMSSKEVAAITMHTEMSLKKARQRLRKKLNISQDIRLNDFFQRL